MDINVIKSIIPWISEFAFFIALLPQIVLNYKIKSTSSLSNLFLIFYFAAYTVNVFYIFGLNLPFAYKVLSPLCVVAVLIIILQKFHYEKIFYNFRMARLYYLSFVFFVAFIPFAIFDPHKVGHVSGWLLVLFWTLYQFPQVYQIYKTKSVVGISFMFLTIIGLANVAEFTAAIVCGLPMQTYFIAIRGMTFYLIYCLQFLLYRKNFMNKEAKKV